MDTQHGQAASTSIMEMQHEDVGMQHGHALDMRLGIEHKHSKDMQ
jgi:hypothetical protein